MQLIAETEGATNININEKMAEKTVEDGISNGLTENIRSDGSVNQKNGSSGENLFVDNLKLKQCDNRIEEILKLKNGIIEIHAESNTDTNESSQINGHVSENDNNVIEDNCNKNLKVSEELVNKSKSTQGIVTKENDIEKVTSESLNKVEQCETTTTSVLVSKEEIESSSTTPCNVEQNKVIEVTHSSDIPKDKNVEIPVEIIDSQSDCETQLLSKVTANDQVNDEIVNTVTVEENKIDNFKVEQIIPTDSSTTSLANNCEELKVEDDDILDIKQVEESMDIEEIEDVTMKDDVTKMSTAEEETSKSEKDNSENEESNTKTVQSTIPCSGLSNTLDILSDDEEVLPNENKTSTAEKQCINLIDDDDIMLIEDDSSSKDSKDEVVKIGDAVTEKLNNTLDVKDNVEDVTSEEVSSIEIPSEKQDSKDDVVICENEKDTVPPMITCNSVAENKVDVNEISDISNTKEDIAQIEMEKPLVAANFIKSFKTKISEMTRDDLEEFCLLKIVEGIVERSNLSEIKTKLKTMIQHIDEWKKKAMMLTKQNRNLQIVLKTVQEEQKKRPEDNVTPLRITRSVGMQVFMTENKTENRTGRPRKPSTLGQTNKNSKTSTNTTPKNSKVAPSPQPQIPVPRLVPATNSTPNKPLKTPPPQVQNSTITSNTGKITTNVPNGVKNTPNTQNKRPFSSVQSVTVDLTDDEPPAKQVAPNRTVPTQQVRLVPPQQLMQARAQFNQPFNSPRKVYIPISGTQNQTNSIRPGQTIMFKAVTTPPQNRIRGANAANIRIPQRPPGVRMTPQIHSGRHPAPLPEIQKQHYGANWKALPPAPDLKISKVENGIVISWKIEGYLDENFEEIASYQLYAYQETTLPPNTSLWKKIGDVKALPLPMACTLTQFIAGYKYYFAVRAVDVKSRVGQFSLPGSILLLNK